MKAPEVAAVALTDHDALAGFLASFPGLPSSPDFWRSRFRLWWQGNPAFAGSPAGWMLRADGSIKGFLGSVPSLFLLDGAPTTVHSVTSWMVLPEYRDHSLALLLEQLRAAEKTLLFDTTPTPEVAEILGSLGFRPLPWAGSRESFILVDGRRCLQAAAPDFLSGTKLAGLGAAALAGVQSLRLKALRDPALRLASAAEEAGDEFDALWQRTWTIWPNTNVRSAQAVRWQCLEDPHVAKPLFVCRQEGRLAGYMVFKARDRRGLRSLDCADFWEDPSAPGVLESLLAAAWLHAQGAALDLLTFPHFSRSLGERLDRAGLFARDSGRQALFCGPPELLDRIRPEDSYLVGLQGDYGTAVS